MSNSKPFNLDNFLASLTEQERQRVDDAKGSEERESIIAALKALKKVQKDNMKSKVKISGVPASSVKPSDAIKILSTPSKRSRGSGSSPIDQADAKKLKEAPSQENVAGTSNVQTISYRDALTGIRLFLTFESYPTRFMNEEEAKKVEKLLEQELLKLPTENATKPSFRSLKYHDGTISCVCRDTFSADWLENASFDLVLDEHKITCYNEQTLPSPPTFKFWIWGEEMDFETFKALILRQNDGLLVNYWHLTKRMSHELGNAIFVKVDFVSAKRIKELGYRIACGFRIIKCYKIGKGNTEEKKDQDDQILEKDADLEDSDMDDIR
jgi:hypothetical protein